jgi:hypothetical protein
MKLNATHAWIIVIFISLIFAILNSITFFAALINQPTNTVYLGTIHYYEDYFFYLNHFFQGAHGAWLTVNRYTSEITSPSIIYWCNVLLGKIGGLIGLSPIIAYNVSILILTFGTLLTSFKLQTILFPKQFGFSISAFLIGNSATSLINRVHAAQGGMTWWPFQIWRTPHFAFDRLGGAPHQLLQTLFSYLILIFLFDQNLKSLPAQAVKIKIFGFIISAILLTTLNPIQSVVTICIVIFAKFWITFRDLLLSKNDNELLPQIIGKTFKKLMAENKILFAGAVITALTFLYTTNVLNQLPHLQSVQWESKQDSYTTWPFLALSIGPALVFAIIGIITRFKKITVLEFYGLTVLLVGYGMFMSKIPQTVGFSNLRLLFPATYVFWGAFAVDGIIFLTKILQKFLRHHTQFIFIIFVILYLVLTIPTLAWEVSFKLPQKTDLMNNMIYLPDHIFAGLTYLSYQTKYDDVTIANPKAHVDLLIPAFSGHTTYSGHMLTTINNELKQKNATQFFNLEMSTNDAKNWMESNKIKYVFATMYDVNLKSIGSTYPFLTKIFENGETIIYKTNI